MVLSEQMVTNLPCQPDQMVTNLPLLSEQMVKELSPSHEEMDSNLPASPVQLIDNLSPVIEDSIPSSIHPSTQAVYLSDSLHEPTRKEMVSNLIYLNQICFVC